MKEGRQNSGVSPEQPAKGAAVLCPPSSEKKKKPSPEVGEEEAPREGQEPSSTLAVGGRPGGRHWPGSALYWGRGT